MNKNDAKCRACCACSCTYDELEEFEGKGSFFFTVVSVIAVCLVLVAAAVIYHKASASLDDDNNREWVMPRPHALGR